MGKPQLHRLEAELAAEQHEGINLLVTHSNQMNTKTNI